ncbi:LssY C-terminal domain-containing protein [Leuconostoc gelidum subsp. gasicomitatum]|uniref:LssY C-terminal domain-containing protein n=1 Tax=Leuconostoc gasicomitatum TaxID=115778 RepID=UPI0007E24D40|nr:LssY C-terminal domain-containing protein [Leuconostoc gasicomitatum]MBZ5948157.1 LssY C-terminal domain-containing protein [Leuconostoc gasicomitatum]CUW05827.1 hypothetical protein PB1E_1513 [Leuconostoc gasicomitatum]
MILIKVAHLLFRALKFVFIMTICYLVYIALLSDILTKGYHIIAYLTIWLLSSYVIAPKVNRFISNHYLPNYFIGRSVTSDGLLGDPVNIAINGSEENMKNIFLESGWHIADNLTFKSSVKIVIASLLKNSYPTAPVSTLYLFNDKQSFAFEKEINNNPRRRHHIRVWKTPGNWYLPGGYKTDWLCAATFDQKVGLSLYNGQITHKIIGNVDQERDFVLNTFKNSNISYQINVVENFTTGYHSKNGGGDRIYTDGALPFVDLSKDI